MEWDNWTYTLPNIIEKSSLDWEILFDTFYVTNQLGDPLILKEEYTLLNNQLEKCNFLLCEYHTIIDHMRKIVYEGDTLCEFSFINDFFINAYKRLIEFGVEEMYNLSVLSPFYFYIPSLSFTWVPIFIMKNTFILNWDMDFYSELQIKISKDANFTLEVSPNIDYKVLRYNGCILYLFEQHKCVTDSSEKEICLHFKLNTLPDQQMCGTVEFGFNQKEYIIDLEKSKNVIEDLNKQVNNLQNEIEEDLNFRKHKIQKKINEYRISFDENLKRCFKTLKND